MTKSAPKKKCSKCGEEHYLMDFHKSRTSYDGLQARCRYCVNKKNETTTISMIRNHQRKMGALEQLNNNI